mmetsp:Transcript_25667/g.71822  ORF Transcript_25667/g.71822 Transcript_25667/m.71822 type:complete len:357 (+) Transcript_25667:25-1095(+)
MNSLEAYRVMQVLDEAQEGLRLLSHIDADILEAAETLGDVIGEDISKSLLTHKIASSGARGQVYNEVLHASSLELIRILKKSPTAEAKLAAMQKERSPAVMSVLKTFEKLRQTAYKKLTTTVEEDNSNKEYFDEVCQREEKAKKDKTTLEQQLKLERRERQKASQLITTAEERARNELKDIQEDAGSKQKQLEETSKLVLEQDQSEFDAGKKELTDELEKLHKELQRLQAQNKEMEEMARKKKTKAEQDVEAWLTEYDKEMGGKNKAYKEEKAVYEGIMAQLKDYTEKTDALRLERKEHEEQERRRKIQELTAVNQQKRLDKAAMGIQSAWKEFWTRKQAEIKKAKKKAKKGKGKK